MHAFALSVSAIKIIFPFPSEVEGMSKSESGTRLSEVTTTVLFFLLPIIRNDEESESLNAIF